MSSNDRLMNDSTLPKKTSASKPKPAPRRRKVGQFGLADWTRLLSVSRDLAQRRGQPLRRIRRSEILQHNTVHDGWIILKGKVYFISPYLAYHPGGQSILQPVLGKDATALYEKYHRWVNEDGLIGKLLIGYLDTSSDNDDSDDDGPSYLPKAVGASSTSSAKPTDDGFPVPPPRQPRRDAV